jgi:hypothetical protein
MKYLGFIIFNPGLLAAITDLFNSVFNRILTFFIQISVLVQLIHYRTPVITRFKPVTGFTLSCYHAADTYRMRNFYFLFGIIRLGHFQKAAAAFESEFIESSFS